MTTATIWFKGNDQPQTMTIHQFRAFWCWLYTARRDGLVVSWSIRQEQAADV